MFHIINKQMISLPTMSLRGKALLYIFQLLILFCGVRLTIMFLTNPPLIEKSLLSKQPLEQIHAILGSQKYYPRFSEVDLENNQTSFNIDLNELPYHRYESNFQIFPGSENTTCFKEGTDFTQTFGTMKCICKESYFGVDCGIPKIVWSNHGKTEFTQRKIPRRIIMGTIVNHELLWTEVRIKQLSNVVDVFIIMESSMTSGGDPKKLHFKEALKNGYLSEYQYKIMYLHLEAIPMDFVYDGWLAEMYLREFWSKHGLSRIANVSDEDIILNFDADEIPKEEALMFLKWYDGWHDPIQLSFRWTLYTFYWQHQNIANLINCGSTAKFLKECCNNNIYFIRNPYMHKKITGKDLPALNAPFVIGSRYFYAGHHCSWCFDAQGIREKLISAQKADKPRWGDVPEFLEETFLNNLIRNGMWFNGRQFLKLTSPETSPDFAPKFVMDHQEQFKAYLYPESNPASAQYVAKDPLKRYS